MLIGRLPTTIASIIALSACASTPPLVPAPQTAPVAPFALDDIIDVEQHGNSQYCPTGRLSNKAYIDWKNHVSFDPQKPLPEDLLDKVECALDEFARIPALAQAIVKASQATSSGQIHIEYNRAAYPHARNFDTIVLGEKYADRQIATGHLLTGVTGYKDASIQAVLIHELGHLAIAGGPQSEQPIITNFENPLIGYYYGEASRVSHSFAKKGGTPEWGFNGNFVDPLTIKPQHTPSGP